MNNEWNVIWKEGDGEMLPKAKHVVDINSKNKAC